ncbi:hypothetical protein [Nonomuraea lactucae]|uniref:hypothetical protein n=1 Tax=Nonomuraea lactucae TaxID=2249762 RepID=UPI0013B371AF|nr:hypothetical protein [Nonomuraea lactucae]
MTVDPEHQVERLTGPPRATRGRPEIAGRAGGLMPATGSSHPMGAATSSRRDRRP